MSDFEGRKLEVFTIYKKKLANKHKINPISVSEIPKELKFH